MTAINHAMTGAIIGLTVQNPALAVVGALLSHFALDVTPHFGWPEPKDKTLKSNVFRNYLIAEAVLCFTLVCVLFAVHPAAWVLASACAFFAASPDLLSINQYVRRRAGREWKPGWYSRFAGGIQWFERPIGAVVEVAWATSAIAVLVNIL